MIERGTTQTQTANSDEKYQGRRRKGNELTTEMQRLVSVANVKIAIAYWGVDALERMDNLNPKRNDLNIVCCLSGGRSALFSVLYGFWVASYGADH
jgi:hypothetical protein